MPEYLITLRNAAGSLTNVHICNVDDQDRAIAIAKNSVLDEDNYSLHSIIHINQEFDDNPDYSF